MKLARLRDADRPRIMLTLKGRPVQAQQGDTLLTALLAAGAGHLRESEFGAGPRAGFCLMGACLGFQLGPGIGAVMTELLLHGRTDVPLDAFRMDRFQERAA